MRIRLLAAALLLLPAVSASAQRPLFDADDFLDPAMLTGPLFVSTLVAGGVANPADRYRPLEGDTGVMVLTNSFHFKRVQFAYRHTEFVGLDAAPPLHQCDCPDPVYFPTPPPARATPAGPSARRSETLQFAVYRTSGERPVTLRYNLEWTWRQLDTTVISPQQASEHRFGRDQSVTLDADTHFSAYGRDVWGTVYFAHASTSGLPTGKRAQNEIGFVYRPPAVPVGPFFVLGKVTAGGISGRGATGFNLFNPYVEAIWHSERTKVTVRAIASVEWTRSGLEGWERNDQAALVLDRVLFVKGFHD